MAENLTHLTRVTLTDADRRLLAAALHVAVSTVALIKDNEPLDLLDLQAVETMHVNPEGMVDLMKKLYADTIENLLSELLRKHK